MDDTELDRLIISNLADLDGAAKQIGQIEARIWREIGGLVSTWAKLKGWRETCDGDDVRVSPPTWADHRYYFQLGWGPDDNGDDDPAQPFYDLCRLVGVAGGRLCLWLVRQGGHNAWKLEVRNNAQELSRTGFLLTDRGALYCDCTPTTSAVADGLADDNLGVALAPIGEALNKAFEAHALLDRMLKETRG